MQLSVIIPVYNIARYLDRCLESIVSQSFSDFEILLVDDGSKDTSGQICDKWEQADTRIKVFHKSNGGVSSARNLGLEHAKGDFITFVDGDDYLLPGMYERSMALLGKFQANIVICGFSNEQSDGSFVPYDNCDEVLTLSQQEQLKCLFTNKHFSCSCWDKVFHRNILNNLRFDTRITHYEDLLFCYEAMKRSNKAVFTAEPFYCYCANEGETASRRPFGDKQMTMLDVWDYIRKDSNALYPTLRRTVDAQYYRNYVMCMNMAKKTNYTNNNSLARMKKIIRHNIGEILASPLAIGYKLLALKFVF